VVALDNSGGIGAAGLGLILAAPVVGSFLGVLIRRLPEGRDRKSTRLNSSH